MKRSTIPLGLATLLLTAGSSPVMAQAPTVSGLLQVWYTQMTDSNLRLNSPSTPPNKYYNLRTEFTENGFAIRRAEIKVAGKITDGVGYEVMLDPSINTSATTPNILQDMFLKFGLGSGLELRVGQMITLQTFERLTSSSELLLAERSQLGRVFGDVRDRGAVLAYSFGDPKEFGAKISAGVFNGTVKQNDANAQKDFVFHAEFNYGHKQKFGFYGLNGSTDQADKGGLTARTFAGASASQPTAPTILAAKDKTSNLGVYYAYNDSVWRFDGELMTGLLGRRAPSVIAGTAISAARENLDQKFLGFYVDGAYTTGNHTFALRYDFLNYNQGNDWYTAYNPYTQSTPGVATGTDYTPKFTEITVGYTYAFKPEKLKAANIKVNYVGRSKNFLKPRVGQTGEQGGDTLVAAFQIAF